LTSKNSKFIVNLCLNINERKTHLPIGDKMASLALSLRNDIELAMDIPLVAQFIVCPRSKLEHIFTFQEEMIVTQDMIDMSDEEEIDWGEAEEEIDWEKRRNTSIRFKFLISKEISLILNILLTKSRRASFPIRIEQRIWLTISLEHSIFKKIDELEVLRDFTTNNHALNLAASFVDLHDLCCSSSNEQLGTLPSNHIRHRLVRHQSRFS
jgi:hypothetical protein